LTEVAHTTNDAKAWAESISNTVKKFPFLVTLATWYELLVKVNAASKMKQQKNMQLDLTVTILENMLEFLREFLETGFDKCVITATELADDQR
jgi:ABC-type uncharacterized transport system YnjBCD substrate-binding protein